MKCGGLRLGETSRNRNVEVERVIFLEMSAAGIFVHCFCLLPHFRKTPTHSETFCPHTDNVLQNQSILKIQFETSGGFLPDMMQSCSIFFCIIFERLFGL